MKNLLSESCYNVDTVGGWNFFSHHFYNHIRMICASAWAMVYVCMLHRVCMKFACVLFLQYLIDWNIGCTCFLREMRRIFVFLENTMFSSNMKNASMGKIPGSKHMNPIEMLQFHSKHLFDGHHHWKFLLFKYFWP